MTIQMIIYLLFFFLFCIPLYVLFRFLYLKSKKQEKIQRNWTHEIGLFAFFVSILLIFYVTIFPTFLMVNQKLYITFKKGDHHQNYIPFQTIKSLLYFLKHHIYLEYAWMNLLGNLFLFFPFALFAKLLFPSFKSIFILLFATFFSLLIEFIQIPMQRISDIDDVILNVIGAGLALIIASFIQKFIKIKKTSSKLS